MNSDRQEGIALISVMIIIALISASIALMWQRFGQDLERTTYIMTQNQSLNHLYSIESWAKTILLKDGNKLDSLEDDWAQKIPPIPVPGGTIHGELIDLHSRFNINNVVDLKTDPYTPQYRSFAYDCLNKLNTRLEQNYMADLILSHVSSQSPEPRLFEHDAELIKVAGISTKSYQAIKPHIVALPTLTTVNVNTTGAEVLGCLHADLSPSIAKQIVRKRTEQAFTNINDFWSYVNTLLPHLTMNQIKTGFPIEFVNVKSEYFLLETQININNNKMLGQTILHRKDGKMTIMNRSYRQAQ